MKDQCRNTFNGERCIGEDGHPSSCLFGATNTLPVLPYITKRLTATECVESMSAYHHRLGDEECDCLGCQTSNDFWKTVMDNMRAHLDAETKKLLDDAYPAQELTWGDSGTIEENNVGIKPGTVIKVGEKLMMSWFPPGLVQQMQGGAVEAAAGMYDPDPLTLPIYPSKPDTWDAKVKRVEWVRANFTPGELAYLYKLSYDADGLRRDGCDEKMKKDGWKP